jgi:hypothetical protein
MVGKVLVTALKRTSTSAFFGSLKQKYGEFECPVPSEWRAPSYRFNRKSEFGKPA